MSKTFRKENPHKGRVVNPGWGKFKSEYHGQGPHKVIRPHDREFDLLLQEWELEQQELDSTTLQEEE
jgi:hypothetical protein